MAVDLKHEVIRTKIKEQTMTFIMISNWKKTFGPNGLYADIWALWGIIALNNHVHETNGVVKSSSSAAWEAVA